MNDCLPFKRVIVHEPLLRISYARAHAPGDSRRVRGKFAPRSGFFFIFRYLFFREYVK